ncbi:MAG: hypothetical protein A2499_15900 [Stygiobacter sp. RIFOXYC12_FULL_38_8]|nr:MAG: hypothetical protein A2X62_14855 [Stygiobacter sp. GWC2_38_9]OGU83839.1 MAG: hypothetical protein A2279_08810 [Stygiobacter sp. RIFOXYA12_FULL_38_9]OGV06256.1 MAG: hypothetical protein A2299_12545 [Stygiobacter sp. RIFOXYB2_FULL_37_11]OGV14357.1 MAG: hypothetical protein A2237_13065 [Stygiobacter sp. RIFOXYA2_FULL_38_8]OGV16007.1 MAG: hypothetical protein A2440_03475 [Stygiobacter sp. RIFOXYC2_FULL_38_25]OGV23798.1 MAG: hypothetical protein A2499_15900 [Stygiobacter sp. RIFOXYC12_FULL_
MNNFKIGDVVYLKSGSPAMTVTSLSEDHCHVAWHDQGKEHTGYYPLEALTKENPNSVPPSGFQKS